MFTAYEYQEKCTSDTIRLLQGGPGVLLELCVGSGKTLVAMMVVSQLHFNRVVVLTPLRDIRRQFEKWSLDSVNLPSGSTVSIPKIRVVTTRKELVRYFDDTRDPSEPQGVVVVTYNIWREAFKRSLSGEFEGNWGSTLVIIDEGHHAYTQEEARKLGVLSWSINEARAKGAKTMQLTATAARYGGESVQLKDASGNPDPRLTRGLLEHINKRYAPYLQSRVIKVSTTKGISDKTRSGSILMPAKEFEAPGFQEIIRDFEANGRPLSIIRIRCQDWRSNRRILSELKKAFRERYGNEVVVATHTDTHEFERWDELVEAMNPKEGKPKSYDEIRKIANVIIVHQKVNEGVDLPAFSNLYLWGIPYSMPLLIQLIGRIMRLRVDFHDRSQKFPGYPERWQDVSRVVFCTSAMGDVVGDNEARLMHQLGAWLHSLELGTLLSRLARIDDGLRGKRPRKKKPDPQEESPLTNDEVCTYAGDSDVWFNEFCSDPLNSISNYIQAKLRVMWALSQATEEHPDLHSELLEQQLKEAIRLSVALKTGDLSVVSGIKDEENLDRATQELIDTYLQRFIESVGYREGNSFTQWVLHGSLHSHYTNLGKDTGVLASEREAFEGAMEFMRAEGRCPGFESSLRRDLVPGKKFGFDRYSKHNWKCALVRNFLASTTLARAIGDARRYWGMFEGVASPQQQRVTYAKFRVDPRFKANPLVTYYPGVLWIPPTFDWVDLINFEDLAKIGSWTMRTTRATHYGSNQGSLNLVDAYIRANGVNAITSLVRSDELDTLLGETEAA